MISFAPVRLLVSITLVAALAGCGDGGGQSCGATGLACGSAAAVVPATVRTLAYVMTDCRSDAQGATIRQSLQIRQDGQEPITILEQSATGGAELTEMCARIGINRQAATCARRGVFHRLGVAPDGSTVVFEVTDEDELTAFPRNSLPTEEKGIFTVRPDGTGLRRLSPPSRDPPYLEFVRSRPFFVFSPNGQKVAYTNRGPSRDNQDAVQIFTLDLTTGETTQVTQLPPARFDAGDALDDTCCPFFSDDETITFLTPADIDGINPQHARISATVKTTDPSHAVRVSPLPVVIPGSQLQTIFHITGSDVGTALLTLPGIGENGSPIREAFVISGQDVLQVTNFHRTDTGFPTMSADAERVFFTAAGNPAELRTNPAHNCQIWSTDRNGGDLQQLTSLGEGPLSLAGCGLLLPPPQGCLAYFLSLDPQTDDLVFYGNCNPVGANPYGTQAFAMHQDGTGLRQLTDARGYTSTSDGSVFSFELPYPVAHPGQAQL